MTHNLSKSQFIRGLQCHKSLWLYKNRRELRTPPDEASLARFAMGDEVGRLAHELFPEGTEIVFRGRDFDKMIAETKALMESGMDTIYEATFNYDDVLVMVDILHREDKEWGLYEVKSSTSAKEVHLNDLAIQYYVLNGCGHKISKASLVHINNDYVRDGDIDVRGLFIVADLTNEVTERQGIVKSEVKLMRDAISRDCPDIDIGLHCETPYPCDFSPHCWAHIPTPSVFDLRGRGINKHEYYRNQVIHFSDLDLKQLNEKQGMQVDSELNDTVIINKEGIKEFLDTLFYPLYFLDFETFSRAIPPFDKTKPYKQIPFQYSLHYLESEGSELKHHEFLSEAGVDQREELVKGLVSQIPIGACILTYNMAFERRILKELADDFPAYKDRLMLSHDSIYDLMHPFQKRYYYTKEMKGSYSLKEVLPAIVPDLSYDGMSISNGGEASSTYSALHLNEDRQEVEQIREGLLEYCKLDTLAMVKLLDRLKVDSI